LNVFEELPFDKTCSSDGNALFDQPSSGKTGGQSGESENTECPFRTKFLDEHIHCEAEGRSPKTAASIDDPVCDTALFVEVLSCNSGYDLAALSFKSRPEIIHSP